MNTLDSDVPIVPTGEASGPSSSPKKTKRFEIKKWNAVAFWAWDIVVDNCAICRNHISWIFASNAKRIRPVQRVRSKMFLRDEFSVVVSRVYYRIEDADDLRDFVILVGCERQ